MVKINVDTRQPLSAQQKTNYINSRPQSVSWYNQLKNEIKSKPPTIPSTALLDEAT